MYRSEHRKRLTLNEHTTNLRQVGSSNETPLPGNGGFWETKLLAVASSRCACDRRVTGHVALRHRVLSVGDRLAHKLSHTRVAGNTTQQLQVVGHSAPVYSYTSSLTIYTGTSSQLLGDQVPGLILDRDVATVTRKG